MLHYSQHMFKAVRMGSFRSILYSDECFVLQHIKLISQAATTQFHHTASYSFSSIKVNTAIIKVLGIIRKTR